MNPELPTSPTARTSNRLTLEQTFALGAWITSHQQQAQDESDTQCAEHAALDLKFTVTPANFAAARQALHIEKTRPATPPTVEERVLKLEEQVEATDRKCESIDRNVANQCTAILTDLSKRNEASISSINQTLANHRAEFEDLLVRLTKLEQRNQPEVQLPLPLPGRMTTEIPPSDIECPPPSEESDSTHNP